MEFLIGIDVGTSNVKAVLFDKEGHEKKVAMRKNEPLHLGDSKVEQDMNVLWDKVLSCLKEVSEFAKGNKILGIGLTGQGEGCWLVDKEGKPISQSLLWSDGRAKGLVDKIVDNKDLYNTIYSHTGTPPLTGTALTLLMWSKENRPEILEKADKIMFAKDWIRYKLTGEIALESSDAGTSLLNIDTLEFEESLFDKVGLSEYKHLISSVNKSYEIAGNLTSEVANLLNLPEETPVSYGALDVIATTMGVGAIHPGDICTILGTTCATNIVTDVIEAGKENSRFEKHILDNMYVDLKPTMSGTTNIDWLFQTVAKDLSYQEVDENLITLPPVPTGVIYHPYLSTAGERSPFYDSNARSSFFGLNNGTDRFSMIKSVYEGIGFSIRDCLEYANVNENSVIYLAGGGAASKAWKQIIADITGLTIVVLEGTEFAAKGSVMGMAVTLGLYETFEDATRSMTHANEVYHPINENAVIYNEFYGLYKTLRNGYTELWAERTKILEKLNRGE